MEARGISPLKSITLIADVIPQGNGLLMTVAAPETEVKRCIRREIGPSRNAVSDSTRTSERCRLQAGAVNNGAGPVEEPAGARKKLSPQSAPYKEAGSTMSTDIFLFSFYMYIQ
ncbi:hypothetical protein EVAR_80164_1 [Eumeta japonica]|uniref:Uncharacterized protein n=1 Tax=Eumeta variegata TaxID=151549 RepID=A0A4C1Y927_EUMVA|nr:hypothetical protein EVAR_80164_1 [Eumeta japonica]